MWGLPEQLLAAVLDALNVANWQRQGDKRAKRPKPIRRPGVAEPGERRFGSKKYTVEQLKRRLGRR